MLEEFVAGKLDAAWVTVADFTRLRLRRNVRSFAGLLYRTLDIAAVEYTAWPDGILPYHIAQSILERAERQEHLDAVFLDRYVRNHFWTVARDNGYLVARMYADQIAYYKVIRDRPYTPRASKRRYTHGM